MNILIVDDNIDLAAGLGDLLEIEGHDVVIASTARQAREQYGGQVFDHVFLDMKLPDGNGLDLYFDIHRQSPTTRLTLMTGYRIEQLLQQMVDNGSVEIMNNPVSPDQLYKSLRNVMPEGMLLVIADKPGFAGILARYLADLGSTAAVICDPGDVEEAVRSSREDVLIVDMGLPVLCSVSIYTQMKNAGRVRPLIMIIDQSRISGGTEDIFRSVSATNCLFKPFYPEEVLDVIKMFETA